MIRQVIVFFLLVFSLYPQAKTRAEEQQYKLLYVDKGNINNITNFYQRCYSRGGKVPSDKKRMISFENKGINSLTGVSQFNETPVIFLEWNPIQNIDEISQMDNLKELWLGVTDIRSISALEKLVNLETLSLVGTNVKSIVRLPKSIKLLYIDDDVVDLQEFLESRKECKSFKFGEISPFDPTIKCKVFLSSDYKKLGKGCKSNKKIGCRKSAKPSPNKACELQPARTDALVLGYDTLLIHRKFA